MREDNADCLRCLSDACLIVKQVNLKSRENSARRRENTNEKHDYPADFSSYVTNDVNGSSGLAGKYALYRPRPGKNVSPPRTQINEGADEGDKGMNEVHLVSEKDATCPPASELTFIYENVDKASFFFIFVFLSLFRVRIVINLQFLFILSLC